MIFISHSSANNAAAIRIRDWLISEGWGPGQIFLDLENINPGERWRQALDNRAANCEGVIACLSDEWISSPECNNEYSTARALGKPTFPVIVSPLTKAIPRYITDVQFANLSDTAASIDGFTKLKAGLVAQRIAPEFFPWPPQSNPQRAPYRGFSALDIEDAGIFFARDGAIARGMDAMRRIADGAAERMLVILGASGAGKSSFLRAGLLARMKRDTARFVALPPVRPERAALTGPRGLFAAAGIAGGTVSDLAAAFDQMRKEAHARLCALAGLDPAAQPPPRIVIAIDQMEELFNPDNTEGPEALSLIAGVLAQDPLCLAVATIRSDAYERVQNAPELTAIARQLFDLDRLGPDAFRAAIEGPAKLTQPPLKIEPELTDRIVKDLAGRDSLPLLAFVMQRLYDLRTDRGALTLADYIDKDRLGGVEGAIKGAVAVALEGLKAEGAKPEDLLEKLRWIFLPALVRLPDSSAKPQRRVARLDRFTPEQQDLVKRLADQRLLAIGDGVVDGEPAITVEIAHEDILRLWLDLQKWIEGERENLLLLETVETAATGWADHGHTRDWIAHSGERLARARSLATHKIGAYRLSEIQTAYLSACAAAQRLRAWRIAGAVAAVPIAVGLAYAAYEGFIAIRSEYLQRQAIDRYEGHRLTAEAVSQLEPGQTFQECAANSADCPVMVVLPSGSFMMGSPASDDSADNLERPQREVNTLRFAVGKFEVTWEEWITCVNAGGCNRYRRAHESQRYDGRYPVFNIDWYDAQDYAAWISRMTGAKYRLLTEAEWEFSARAVTRVEAEYTAYSWGNSIPECDPTSDRGAQFVDCSDPAGPMEVGTFIPNAFGLHDLHGNILEWVQDCIGIYGQAANDGSAAETANCSRRVLRGGSWDSNHQDIRSADRYQNPPDMRFITIGFRLARTL